MKRLITVCVVLCSLAGNAQTSVITYQGQLTEAGLPASGNYDFMFRLMDAATDGSAAPVIPINPAVTVSNGLFMTAIDFGAENFPDAPRWLEINVRTNGAETFAALSPRQLLASAPYAIRSAKAGIADTAASVPATALTGTIPDGQLSANVAQLVGGKLPEGNLSANVALLNANQNFTGTNTFNKRIAVNGLVESISGGMKFPDGSIQTKAASTPKIIASANMQFSIDDRSGWTHIEALGDDSSFFNIPLGFTYTGFGVNTAIVSFSSNGILFFGNNASSAFGNTGLPTSISNDAMLFFFWDDLDDFGGSEYAEYATFGTAPNRVFNFFFRARLHDTVACGTNLINVMVSIHEGSNLIKATYSGFTGCANLRGASATLGFQTPGGASATAFCLGFNVPLLDDNTPGQFMSFHPSN